MFNTFQDRWQQYREASKCFNLRRELWLLLYGKGNEEALARMLIKAEKCIHPGELESWYLEKVIYKLRKRFTAY